MGSRDWQDEEPNDSFQTIDGWNEDTFEDAEIMSVLRQIEEAIYEIKNARRGSYADMGETTEEFLFNLAKLGKMLTEVCNDANNNY